MKNYLTVECGKNAGDFKAKLWFEKKLNVVYQMTWNYHIGLNLE